MASHPELADDMQIDSGDGWFAVIATALGDGVVLEPLDDELEQLAHADARKAAGL